MILWTIQTLDAYQDLERRGHLSGDRKYAFPEFHQAYQWMVEQMIRRIEPPPDADAWPIWAWYQYSGEKKPRPDLRSTEYLPKGTRGARIEIEPPDDQVVLSDFDLWHYVLNYWHLSRPLYQTIDRTTASRAGG